MSDWSGVRGTIGPAAIAVLVAVQLASFGGSASAHGAAPTAIPVSGGENTTVDHSLHGPATVTPLATDCSGSALSAHDGFQEAPTCSSTAFGEVAAQANDAQLLIVKAPRIVKVGQPITLKVSTRNLKRDRFLAAGQGGYYLETSLLNGDGIVRGHFHSECRNLASTKEAPQPDRAGNGLFVATEDGGGSATPDTVTVTLPGGLQATGIAQCAVWAGDGSHRVPMMQFANQVPAFDAVRVLVVRKDEQRNDVDGNEDPANNRGAKANDGG
jgi:hypothetical protein